MKTMLGALAICGLMVLDANLPVAAATKNRGVSDIQSMLAECGFNPGPVDGQWGQKTAKAASDYVRAHGGSPVAGDRSSLMAQVDGYRVGDQGPCPATMTNENASGAVEQTDGSADRAETRKTGGASRAKELTAQIVRELDGKTGVGKQSGRDHSISHETKIQIQGDTITIMEVIHQVKHDAPKGSNDSWVTRRIKISDVGSAAVGKPGSTRGAGRGRLRLYCRDRLECVTGEGRRATTGYFSDFARSGRYSPAASGIVIDNDFVDLGINVHSIRKAFNQLDELRSKQQEPSSECIKWADLGSIASGAWRNGKGHITKGFEAGDLGKSYNRPELVKNYEASHRHCLDINEHTMQRAIADMVIVGRQAKDVDSEKQRIRNYFQGKVRECQAEFANRFRKYEKKFCE